MTRKKRLIQSRVVFLKIIFSLQLIPGNSFFRVQYFTKVVAVNYSSMDTLFLRRALTTINCIYKMYLTDISIKGGFLFQRSTCDHTFEWYHHHFRRPLAVIQYSQGHCVSFKQALAVIPFFIGNWVNSQVQLQPFIRWITIMKE